MSDQPEQKLTPEAALMHLASINKEFIMSLPEPAQGPNIAYGNACVQVLREAISHKPPEPEDPPTGKGGKGKGDGKAKS